MLAAAIALATLLDRCAPDVGARTMTAIVRVESNANPLAIHDNSTRRSFAPRTITEAIVTAGSLIGAGHSVDLGIGQINSNNFAMLRLSVREAFDPCANLRAGATILTGAYAEAAKRLGPGPYALRRAIGAYNSGSIFAGDAYIDRILAAAGLPAQSDNRLPDLEAPEDFARVPAVVVRIVKPTSRLAPRSQPIATARPDRVTRVKRRSADPYASSLLVTGVAPTPSAASTPAAAVAPKTVAPAPPSANAQ